jgi:N-glycosylase/DNA lyase
MKESNLIIDDGKKGLTKKRYLKYEDILKRVAEMLDMPLGKMDLYLWYSKTGKVLK